LTLGLITAGFVIEIGRPDCYTPAEQVQKLTWLAERNSLAAIHRAKGIKGETVLDWLRGAARHVRQIEALLLAHYHPTHAQPDALWTYAGHKGARGASRGR